MTISTKATGSAPYPQPKNVGNPATLGLGIQRTMALLASSTPDHPNTVRILFYGQSITEQDWWKDVAEDLKRRFPSANLIIENRALGGFASQLLCRTAETDIESFRPDLMIFHVYGAHNNYEDIIRLARQRTTAEVLIQTDHITNDADLNEETDPSKLRPDGKIWSSFMNYLWLPKVARKYGCGVVDQRNLWKQYLRDNNLHASQLLKDGVHQNEFGNYVMAKFVEAYLVRRSDTPIDPMNCSTVRIVNADKFTHVSDRKWSLPFDGNRIDLVVPELPSSSGLRFRIDGKRPSEIPDLYRSTRAMASVGGKWPVILKVGSNAPLRLEDWSMQVTRDAGSEKVYNFALTGSVTGPDGSGRSDQAFVSKSGRVAISPDDWNVEYSLGLAGIKPPPDAFSVHWKVVPYFVDSFPGAGTASPTRVPAGSAYTIVQGLVNGPHVLEITADNNGSPAPDLKAVIYRPPVPTGEMRVVLDTPPPISKG